MLYNIVINQKALIDNAWNLKATHIAILEVIAGFALSSKSVKMTDESGTWVWIKASLIVAQIPMFDIKERWVSELIKDLEKYQLVERHPESQKLGRSYVRIGANYDRYKSFVPMQENDKGMQKNAKGYAENFEGGMQKNADDNNITYNSHKENNSAENQKKSEIVGKNKTLPLNNKKEKNELPQKDLAPVVLDNSNIANTEDFVYFHELFDPEQNDNILEWLQKSEYQNENLCPQRIFDYINQNDRHKGRKKYYQWKSTISAALAFKRNDGKLKEFFGKNINQQANEQTDFATRITNSLAAQAERDANNPLFN